MDEKITSRSGQVVSVEKVLFYYLLSIGFAAIITPIFWVFLTKISEVCDNSIINYIIRKGFIKTFDRVRLFPLIFIVIWLMKKSGMQRLRDFFIKFDNQSTVLFFVSFIVGASVVLGLISLHLIIGKVDFDGGSLFFVAFMLLRALISGLLIALCEEVLFRRLLQSVFCYKFGIRFGIVLVSLFFAYLHYKIPYKSIVSDQPFIAGLQCAFFMIFGIFKNFNIISFLNLFLLGVILSHLVVHYHSLLPSIGLHAGIVSVMLCAHFLFSFEKVNHAFINGRAVINSVAATCVLGVMATFLWFKTRMVRD